MTKPPDLKNHIDEWLTYADGDFRSAKQLLKSENPSWHTVCFLSQASAEKYLKAYLISRGWKLRKTHDLAELSEYAIEYEQNFSYLLPVARILNDYTEAGR